MPTTEITLHRTFFVIPCHHSNQFPHCNLKVDLNDSETVLVDCRIAKKNYNGKTGKETYRNILTQLDSTSKFYLQIGYDHNPNQMLHRHASEGIKSITQNKIKTTTNTIKSNTIKLCNKNLIFDFEGFVILWFDQNLICYFQMMFVFFVFNITFVVYGWKKKVNSN